MLRFIFNVDRTVLTEQCMYFRHCSKLPYLSLLQCTWMSDIRDIRDKLLTSAVFLQVLLTCDALQMF